jgi:hypothetical protein
VLAEAGRISDLFDVPLHLIHAAEETSDKVERFRGTLRSLKLSEDAPIHFQAGSPSEAILNVLSAQQIDLLIAGALEQESVHRNFTGDVARSLLREAPCDLFLFVEPKEGAPPPGHVFVAIPDFTPFSRQVSQRGANLAERIGAKRLTLLHVQTTFAEAKEKALGADARKYRIHCLRVYSIERCRSLGHAISDRRARSTDLRAGPGLDHSSDPNQCLGYPPGDRQAVSGIQ